MQQPVLQKSLPHAPWMRPATWRLPGVQPLGEASWLCTDDAFTDQMALRDRLIANKQGDVYRCLPEATAAAGECLDHVLATLKENPEYHIDATQVTRPDGVTVTLQRADPLLTIGRLIQEDICLMLPGAQEHVLGGAILCFPASWTLSQKIGRPLMRIHKPVSKYTDDVGRRVQRLFDAVRVETPMWRANAHLHDSPDLFAPRLEDPEHAPRSAAPPYLRSERQTLKRLPESNAVVFAIHTWMVAIDDLTEEQRNTLDAVAAQYG